MSIEIRSSVFYIVYKGGFQHAAVTK